MAFCPHCGLDLTCDEPVVAGPLRYDPRGRSTYNGLPLHLSPSLSILLGSLVCAGGSYVRADALLNRMDSSGGPNTLCVQIRRLRIVVPRGRWHIQSKRGFGYRWRP